MCPVDIEVVAGLVGNPANSNSVYCTPMQLSNGQCSTGNISLIATPTLAIALYELLKLRCHFVTAVTSLLVACARVTKL